jgi:hypothetical protein
MFLQIYFWDKLCNTLRNKKATLRGGLENVAKTQDFETPRSADFGRFRLATTLTFCLKSIG